MTRVLFAILAICMLSFKVHATDSVEQILKRLAGSYAGQFEFHDERIENWRLNIAESGSFQFRREVAVAGQSSKPQFALGAWRIDSKTEVLLLDAGKEKPIIFKTREPGRLLWADPDIPAVSGEMARQDEYQNIDLESLRISGMMVYFADSAMIQVCSSGEHFPVVQKGNYIDLERAYLKHKRSAGEPLYVIIQGAIKIHEMMEGPNRQAIVVEKFERVIPDQKCESDTVDIDLVDTEWQIEKIFDETVTVDKSFKHQPVLQLKEGQPSTLALTVGCNRMRGSAEFDAEKIKFGPVMSTMMACPDELARLERLITEALNNTAHYKVDGNRLIFLDENQDSTVQLRANKE